MTILLSSLIWFALFISVLIFLAYKRFDLRNSTITTGVALAIYTALGTGGAFWFLVLWIGFGCMAILNIGSIRKKRITAAAFNIYKTMVPDLSKTERGALEAGTVGWDGELFTGHPNWNQWLAIPKPKLSDAEQAFLDGPCEELCHILDDWQIVHELGDLPPEVWDYIKQHQFFAMKIPVEYGGLGFSATAVAKVLAKLVGRSVVAG